MTPPLDDPGGPAAHLTSEDLADVDGIVGHEHLMECGACRAEWQQQRAVRDLLRGLPDPGPVPPDVAAGLQEAFAQLAPAGSSGDHLPVGRSPQEDVRRPARTTASTASTASTAEVVPHSPPVRRDLTDRLRPWLAAAAAVIVLGGGGAALVERPWSAGGGAASSVDTTAEAGAVGAGDQGAARDASAVVVATGTDYVRDDLPAQVRANRLAEPRPADASASPLSGEVPGDGRLAVPDGLASCLSALGVDADGVTAVDLARFEGEPAAVIVVHPDAGTEDVWVVGRGCRQGDDQTRYFVRLP